MGFSNTEDKALSQGLSLVSATLLPGYFVTEKEPSRFSVWGGEARGRPKPFK